MLTGRVTSDKEAVLPIEVLGVDGRIFQSEAGIDTGYNGFLTLPRAVIEELDLTFVGPARAAVGIAWWLPHRRGRGRRRYGFHRIPRESSRSELRFGGRAAPVSGTRDNLS